MDKQGKAYIWVGLFFVMMVVSGLIIFAIPIPYTAKVVTTVKEPYAAYESFTTIIPYTEKEIYQEQVPITVEECKTDISLNQNDYITRGIENIDALLAGDINALLETCQNVIQYRTVSKERDVLKTRSVVNVREVVRYRDVQKTRTEQRTATLYQRWTGQVVYYFEE